MLRHLLRQMAQLIQHECSSCTLHTMQQGHNSLSSAPVIRALHHSDLTCNASGIFYKKTCHVVCSQESKALVESTSAHLLACDIPCHGPHSLLNHQSQIGCCCPVDYTGSAAAQHLMNQNQHCICELQPLRDMWQL